VALTLAVALASTQTPALAGPKVSGNPEAVTVDAQNSSIDQVLAALSREFKLQYRSSVDLKTEITGIYEGSLPRVAARILEGYNFVLRSSPNGIEVTVLGSHVAQGSPQPSTTPAQAAQKPQATPSATAQAKAAPNPEIKTVDGVLPPPPAPKPVPSGSSLPTPPRLAAPRAAPSDQPTPPTAAAAPSKPAPYMRATSMLNVQ
jgi:hypothetical protein